MTKTPLIILGIVVYILFLGFATGMRITKHEYPLDDYCDGSFGDGIRFCIIADERPLAKTVWYFVEPIRGHYHKVFVQYYRDSDDPRVAKIRAYGAMDAQERFEAAVARHQQEKTSRWVDRADPTDPK